MKIRSLISSTARLMAPLTVLAASVVCLAQNIPDPTSQPLGNSSFARSSFDSSSLSASEAAPEPAPDPAVAATRGVRPAPAAVYGPRPFSRFSIGGSATSLGFGVETSTNLFPHLNLRLAGDYLGFAVNNLNEQGFNVDGNLHLASARAAVDYYPFHKGFRLSPGVMFYNQNHALASVAVPSGSAFTVNDETYYSESGAEAVHGAARLRLGSSSPVFTATTGWGNTIARVGHHFSFPFEAGVAFQDAPTMAINLAGTACYDSAHLYCTDIADTSNPLAVQIQQGVQTQAAKYQKDLQPLKTYPILSFGVAYSFGAGRISQVR